MNILIVLCSEIFIINEDENTTHLICGIEQQQYFGMYTLKKQKMQTIEEIKQKTKKQQKKTKAESLNRLKNINTFMLVYLQIQRYNTLIINFTKT